MSEVVGRGNVVFIREETEEAVVAKVKRAKELGLHSIIVVQNVFFPWHSSHIHPDYPARFRYLWSHLAPYRDWIRGFYLFDEPFWNNVATPGWNQAHNFLLRDAINAASHFIKNEVPGIPTIVVFAYTEMNFPAFSADFFPRNVDWVGFDCYKYEGEPCSEANVRRLFAQLKSIKTDEQKIVLVPDAAVRSLTEEEDYHLVHRLKLYKDLAAWNLDVVAIFPFQYQNNHGEKFWGAESLPHIRNELQIYYQGLKGELRCVGNDLIHVQSMTVGWANAPVCTPSCEGPWLIRRDADGRQLSSEISSACR